ncbi:hypothetical protein [Roseiconus lacunae]|uniref:hypothetical protein n=1 Tax=Roseiconus lacunae TaxID=2605694 RepID=UPI0011F1B67D|nr:hypothetical protein [Roseiconus lacunae]
MKMFIGLIRFTFVAVLGCVVLVGCDSAELATTDASQDRPQATAPELLLSEAPEGEAKTPTEIKEAEMENEVVVIAGRIDAGDSDPFQPGEVAFMISQLPDEDHAGGDPEHADNCPFCKRKLAMAPKAIVRFVGADGNVIPGDARTALGIKKGDVVLVTGSATFNADIDTVMVDATKLHLR